MHLDKGISYQRLGKGISDKSWNKKIHNDQKQNKFNTTDIN